MTENISLNYPKKLADADLSEVTGGAIPDFVYEFESELGEEYWQEIVYYFKHKSGLVDRPYRLLWQRLSSMGDHEGAKRVEEYFYERYEGKLFGQ